MRIALLFALVAGCGIDLPDEPATSSVEQKMCPKFGCGGDNSPWIAGAYFHDLDKLGTRNREGFTFTGFVGANNLPYQIDVKHGRLSGTSANGTIAGKQLVGARIKVRLGSVDYAIRIDEVTTVPYWANNGQQPAPVLEAYKLDYYEWNNPGHTRPLCKNADPENDEDLSMSNGLAFYTLMFENDRINDELKTVTLDMSNRWFNFGCAGGAPAKLYLTGHTYAAGLDGFATTPDERQTMLKMFTADYCGDGIPYTVAGQPLTWADSRQWMHMLDSATTLETRWQPSGAMCVGVPRASVAGTPASESPDLSWIQSPYSIVNACAARGKTVQPCTNMTLTLGGAHVASANYLLQ